MLDSESGGGLGLDSEAAGGHGLDTLKMLRIKSLRKEKK